VSNKLSVAYLSPGWPLAAYPNGIVTYIQNIISGFDEQVISTIMTTKLESGYLDDSVIDLSQLSKNNSYFMRALLRGGANKYIEKKNIDYKFSLSNQSVIKAVNSLDKTLHILELEETFGRAQYLIKKIAPPLVTRLHGPWFIHGPIMKLDRNTNYQDRVASEGEGILVSQGVTAPSLNVLNKVREFYGCLLPEAKVIPNPILPVSKENQWQYDPKLNQTILVVGRFDLHKGGDLGVDAFRIIASKNKEVELLFVGPDRGVIVNNQSYNFFEYVDYFIPESSIKERIKFLGHCNAHEIAKLRKKSTITVMCSRYDNFPMSLLEAVATGSPVVVTAVGGMTEIIINDFNGLLAEPESPESIADNILQLLDNPEKMKFLSRNAIKDSQERFSPEIVAKQTEMYYRSIITTK